MSLHRPLRQTEISFAVRSSPFLSVHQDQARIEAHIFIAFLAYCLHATLARRLHALAPGEEFCDILDRAFSPDAGPLRLILPASLLRHGRPN